METLRAFIIANPLLATVLSTLWAAIIIDLTTFANSKAPGEFFTQFSFKVAFWRYAQAIVSGFIGTALVAGGGAALALLLWSLL